MQILHTVTEEMADPAHGLYRSAISDGVHDEALDYLNSVTRKTTGTEITLDAYEGNVVSQIIEEAGKSTDSLIAMTTHGRSGVSPWLMGSVTDTVLHHTKHPMLISRGHHEGEPEIDTNLDTIIVPLDGSPLAEEVLPHVEALAIALDLKVTLLRAAATEEVFSAATGIQRMDGVTGVKYQDFQEIAHVAGTQAKNYLEEKQASLRLQGVATMDHSIIDRSAAQVIVDVAQATPNNLVAMTTHGRSGPARWTMGSVTDRVVRRSGDPVLVIRTG